MGVSYETGTPYPFPTSVIKKGSNEEKKQRRIILAIIDHLITIVIVH